MTIGFIGVGGMAQAIITGLVKSGQVNAGDIIVHSAHAQSYESFAKKNWDETSYD